MDLSARDSRSDRALAPAVPADYLINSTRVASLDYIHVTYGEPHAQRGRRMLAAHPELRALAGTEPLSGLWTLLLVLAQFALALAVANRLVAILANLPLVVPGAISFGKYHLLHHRHMGDLDFDAGIPGPTEARVIGRSGIKKATWIAGTIFVQGVVRPSRMKKVTLLDGWTLVNIVVQIGAMALLVYLAGVAPLKYLAMSTVFAIGLHPLGARWIQEHFALVPGQETYSYYGPLNKVSFNVGYHNEHHDIVTIPWSRLPQVRRIAPEFYDALHSYSSWTSLLLHFLRDRNITLFNAIVRPGRAAAAGGSTQVPGA